MLETEPCKTKEKKQTKPIQDGNQSDRRRLLQACGTEETDHLIPGRQYLRRIYDRIWHLRFAIWSPTQCQIRGHVPGHVGVLRTLQHGRGAMLCRAGHNHTSIRGRIYLHSTRIRTFSSVHLSVDDVHFGPGCHDDGVFFDLRDVYPDAGVSGLRPSRRRRQDGRRSNHA